MTGYLTQGSKPADETELGQNEIVLRIPNEEVKSIFKTAIVEWFNESVKTTDRKALFEAVWNGDAGKAAQEISNILFTTISYHDYKESYYHAFMAGLFAGAGYIVESNYEHGTGRPDVVIKDKKKRRAVIIETKHAASEEKLAAECENAVRQIIDRRYALGLEKGYKRVLSY
ncbi:MULTISPECIES: PD-(D/E)XK nuclease domain-containing protein [Blautia]|uniref:PD-(D/E)XK nuclease domain-containing protein n=1 Tax=Blautia TaxID=572511 RepID=UPI0029FF0704|nr:PD-(D/E)XK nuclease domain-containing protein [Blautia marasmi]